MLWYEENQCLMSNIKNIVFVTRCTIWLQHFDLLTFYFVQEFLSFTRVRERIQRAITKKWIFVYMCVCLFACLYRCVCTYIDIESIPSIDKMDRLPWVWCDDPFRWRIRVDRDGIVASSMRGKGWEKRRRLETFGVTI